MLCTAVNIGRACVIRKPKCVCRQLRVSETWKCPPENSCVTDAVDGQERWLHRPAMHNDGGFAITARGASIRKGKCGERSPAQCCRCDRGMGDPDDGSAVI